MITVTITVTSKFQIVVAITINVFHKVDKNVSIFCHVVVNHVCILITIFTIVVSNNCHKTDAIVAKVVHRFIKKSLIEFHKLITKFLKASFLFHKITKIVINAIIAPITKPIGDVKKPIAAPSSGNNLATKPIGPLNKENALPNNGNTPLKNPSFDIKGAKYETIPTIIGIQVIKTPPKVIAKPMI
ncbi:ORF023 [Staphylococcus phage 187]|uniref:ORF023 n=1 Tax=Staphylococcus phage 187 TaxID=2908096 RepID=Q4ZE23_9CAUD|nr:ORF023 [Staphylococcus phage 187]AAX90701.1 ORF023 [Staphylococcus phage 187]